MKTISWAFIRKRTDLSWKEAAWGYHHKYLGWSDVVELACDRLAAGEDDAAVVELAGVVKSDAHEVGQLIDKLVSKTIDSDEEFTKAKWLYLNLAWLFENQTTVDDSLEAIEIIYADFEYPEEITSFVRYMPVTDGYDPSAHTAEENQARLIEKWQSYLAEKASVFASAQ
jgi:hypothetical protein